MMTNKKRDLQLRIYEMRQSPYQFAVLSSLAQGNVYDAGSMNMTTLGALVKRQLVRVDDFQKLHLTAQGLQVFETYKNMAPPMRNKPGDVTDHVIMLIAISRERKKKEKTA